MKRTIPLAVCINTSTSPLLSSTLLIRKTSKLPLVLPHSLPLLLLSATRRSVADVARWSAGRVSGNTCGSCGGDDVYDNGCSLDGVEDRVREGR